MFAKRNGHNIVAELHNHVESFRLGLDRFADELHERREVVHDRIADLEHELSAVQSGLDRIVHHHKES